MASALSLLRVAAALEPERWTTWHSLGTVHRAQRDDTLALISQRRAHILGADNPLCRLQLTILEALGGHSDAARAHLRATLDAAPDLAKYAPNDVVMATARAGKTLTAALLAEDLVVRLPALAGAPEALHFTRARLAKTAGDIQNVIARWGTGSGPYHPDDAQRRQRAPGYVLIRGWGTGFWAEVFHAANNLAFAEITGRIPFVYWGEEVRYRGAACTNAWEQFFEPVAPIDLAELERAGAGVFPRSWTPETLFSSEPYRHIGAFAGNPLGIGALSALNRPEPLVVADGFVDISDVLAWTPAAHRWASLPKIDVFREIFSARFRLKPAVSEAISALASRLFSGPMIAVHARSQSQGKNNEALEGLAVTMELHFAQTDRWLDADRRARLFLLTDSESAVAAFRERYGPARIVTLDRARVSKEQDSYAGLGLPRVSDVGFDMGIDGYSLGLEVLTDAYLAARCDRFIGDGASAVSCAILNLKRWPDEDVFLIRQNVYLERCHWKTPA